MRLLALAVIAVLFAVPATAQDQDPETNCTQADPCPWVMDVDDDGFDDGSFEGPSFNGTEGDWIRLEVFNFGDQAHTIAFAGHGTWTIASLEQLETEPILLDEAGSFRITDEPSGDEVPVQVFLNDASAVDGGEDPITDVPSDTPTTSGNGAPGAAVALLLAGLGMLASRRR